MALDGTGWYLGRGPRLAPITLEAGPQSCQKSRLSAYQPLSGPAHGFLVNAGPQFHARLHLSLAGAIGATDRNQPLLERRVLGRALRIDPAHDERVLANSADRDAHQG
jgi:hypothetical protein